MSLKDRLVVDRKDAMRNRETDRLSTIRMVRSSIRNREIDPGRELKEEEAVGAVSAAVKKIVK